MLQTNPQAEFQLVKAVLSGDSGAAHKFLDAASATLWSAVVQLEGDGAAGEAAFLEVTKALAADGFARLRPFDGRSRLATYLAILTRDILADRLARGFVEAPSKSWVRFERFFGKDIRRRIERRFPRETGTGRRDDLYQEICLKFIEDDYKRIRAYDGLGSFTGFILTVTERILIDLIRRDAPRRRLPAAVSNLPQLDQDIYAAVVWGTHPADPERLVNAMKGRFDRDPDLAEIRAAMERLSAVVPLAPAAPSARSEFVSLDTSQPGETALAVADPGATPEQELLDAEAERVRADLLALIRSSAKDLPAEERLYLQIVFSATDPLPAREIAKLMQVPVEVVYRLKQRAQKWLTEIAARVEKK
jgi:RNA polymerase primary sigma factor